MVPAVTINPSLNLVRAKSLASASVANVLVRRGCRRLDSVPSVGTSKVTYHVWFMPRCRHPVSVACPPHRDDKSRRRETVRSFLARDRKQVLYRRTPTRLTPPFTVATGVMTDRSARHRTRPEHDACPRNATGGISDVLAVHDRLGWRWIESETCKPQQGASSNPGNCR